MFPIVYSYCLPRYTGSVLSSVSRNKHPEGPSNPGETRLFSSSHPKAALQTTLYLFQHFYSWQVPSSTDHHLFWSAFMGKN